MRVALADDSALFRQGLAALMAAAGIEVVLQARDGRELEARLERMPVLPDVAVLDIRMPPTFTDEGLASAERIRQRNPGIGVLLLSTYAQAEYAARLLAAHGGAVGYLLKDRVDDLRTLTSALSRICAGESVVDADLVDRLLSRHRRPNAFDRLTFREKEVLRLMAEGRSNAGISAQMHLSIKTVEAHVAAVFAKLDLQAESAHNRRVLAVLSWLRTTAPVGEVGAGRRAYDRS